MWTKFFTHLMLLILAIELVQSRSLENATDVQMEEQTIISTEETNEIQPDRTTEVQSRIIETETQKSLEIDQIDNSGKVSKLTERKSQIKDDKDNENIEDDFTWRISTNKGSIIKLKCFGDYCKANEEIKGECVGKNLNNREDYTCKIIDLPIKYVVEWYEAYCDDYEMFKNCQVTFIISNDIF